MRSIELEKLHLLPGPIIEPPLSPYNDAPRFFKGDLITLFSHEEITDSIRTAISKFNHILHIYTKEQAALITNDDLDKLSRYHRISDALIKVTLQAKLSQKSVD